MATKPPMLDERIKSIRAEIDALIDNHVAKVSTENPGVPLGVIRQTIVGYNAGCQCAAFAALTEKGLL